MSSPTAAPTTIPTLAVSGSAPAPAAAATTPPVNIPSNVYTELSNNLVNYSALYETPSQLSPGIDQTVAYADALITGISPAYINSPTIPGNRYFINTSTLCADSTSNIHTRSVLVDNVLKSSVYTLGKTSSGQENTGLLYSLMASLQSVGQTLSTPSSMSTVPIVSSPSVSASPSPSTAYLTNPDLPSNLPLCVPVSVYIDGTNTGTASGWILTSDMSTIDPLAISTSSSTGQTVEGFDTSVLSLASPAGSMLKPSDTGAMVGNLKNHVQTENKKATQQTIQTQIARYTATYGPTYYPFLSMTPICNPSAATTAPGSTTGEMLNAFITYVSSTQSTTMPLDTVVNVLQMTSVSGDVQAFQSDILKNTGSQQSLLQYLSTTEQSITTKPPVSPYLTPLLPSWNRGDPSPFGEDGLSDQPLPTPPASSPPSTVPGSPVPPQYIVNPDYVSYQNQYIQYQNQYTQYQNMYLYYQDTNVNGFVPTTFNLVAPANPYANNPYTNNPYTNNPNPEYIINPAYCSFITGMEAFRKPIINAFVQLDYPDLYSNTQEGFTTVVLDTNRVDWLEVAYYSALCMIGLYVVYCIYRKHRGRW